MINRKEGKYIGYLTLLESSTIVWSDGVKEIEAEWSFGTVIFESAGLTAVKLKELFPTPPERGVILDYFKNNLRIVYKTGKLIGELNSTRKPITEKTNQ